MVEFIRHGISVLLVCLLAVALLFTACASKQATQAPAVASDISKGEVAKDQASLVDSLRAKNVEREIGDAIEQAFSQELFAKFTAIRCRKKYNIENITNILH